MARRRSKKELNLNGHTEAFLREFGALVERTKGMDKKLDERTATIDKKLDDLHTWKDDVQRTVDNNTTSIHWLEGGWFFVVIGGLLLKIFGL